MNHATYPKKKYIYIYISRNLFKFVSVLLSASEERVGVSRIQDFHQLGPTGPSWSVSRHVRVCVCVCVCAIVKHPLPEVV